MVATVTMRNQWVDCAKGIGIILVVYGHVARGLHEAGKMASFEHAFALVDSVIYTFHMPLFFLLSGLFFMDAVSRRGLNGFFVGRMKTIVYPYVLWSLLQGFLEVFLSRYTNGKVSFGEVLALFWDPRAQYWFLYALFFVSMFAALVFHISGKSGIYALGFFALIIYLFESAIPKFVPLNFIVHNMVFFVFGSILADRSAFEWLQGRSVFWVILLVLFVCFQYFLHVSLGQDYKTSNRLLAFSVASISIAFIVVTSGLGSGLVQKAFCFLGFYSLEIYILHIIFGSGARILLSHFFGLNDIVLQVFLGMFFGISFPIMVAVFSRKIGFNYLFRL